jgi:formate dehydrogenase iron-sulfur subunit
VSTQLEWDATPRLVDLLIEEQQTLSVVDDFSAFHDTTTHDMTRYDALIPSGSPDLHQQYAFRVDLDACTGCKACVTACHNLNGLEEDELWRKVGLVEDSLNADSLQRMDQQTVTSACHHCESPGCLSGCPVNAYEKDPTTGIVRHLDDQCIGCRYCQLMCPYDVPTYSERLGVVRKCDMCQGRLAAGEAPACVQGCPNEAISISIVDSNRDRPDRMLPVAPGVMPESNWTRPTTTYVSARGNPKPMIPVDSSHVRPAEGHTPLAIMLVLTQAAIGALCLEGFFAALPGSIAPGLFARAVSVSLATAIGLAGLGASILHLGRPLWAFRAILGLRTSWMSREIVVLGGFAGLLVATLAVSWIDWAIDARILGERWQAFIAARGGLIAAAAVIGLLGLFCSIKIYAVTGRPLWRFDRTLIRFGSTALWGGVAVANLGLSIGGIADPGGSSALPIAMLCVLIALTIVKIELESGWLVSGNRRESLALERTRALLSNRLQRDASLRRGLLFVAGCLLPVLQIACLADVAGTSAIAAAAMSSLVIGLAAEFFERSLFFRSEAMLSMPGTG